MQLQAYLLHKGRAGRYLAMRYGSGGIVEARNKVAQHFLAGTEEWLFWVDTDMGFTADSVDRLLESADPTDRPVVGGLCFANKEVEADGMSGFQTFPTPTIYRWGQNPDGRTGFYTVFDYERDSLVDCVGTGSAFLLIHRSVLQAVFEKHGPHWYTPIPNPDTGGWFSEDLSFCIRLVEVDARLVIDTSVKTTHHKPVWISETHLDMHLSFAATQGVTPMQMIGGSGS